HADDAPCGAADAARAGAPPDASPASAPGAAGASNTRANDPTPPSGDDENREPPQRPAQ
ncbi:chloride channel protein, partial [Burkholderia pseudomallei]